MNTNWYAIEVLAREHQAELRREAETARLIRSQNPAQRLNMGWWRPKLVLALGCAIPVVLLIIRAVVA